MLTGAPPSRGASQPATDGSQTAGASRAPSGASLVEGHLTKHWDGDDNVGGAHQAVTDADKKSDDAGHSRAAAAAATASAGPFGTRVGRLTQGRLNLTQGRRQRTTVRPTRRTKRNGSLDLHIPIGSGLGPNKELAAWGLLVCPQMQ